MALQLHISAPLKADLYTMSIADGQGVILLGETSIGDTALRYYYYNASSSATDDGENVIKPTGISGNGRYIKNTNVTSSSQIISALGLTPVDQAGVRSSVSLTTTGTSGAATYNSSTGAFNIPQYSTPTLSFNNAPGRSVVSTTGATGFQVSSSRSSLVNYSVTINTSISLSGNATGYVALQICSTNSATAGDWVEIARTASGQTGTLVVGLVLNQIGGGNLSGVVPAGYYAKLLSVNSSGTPTYTYNSGQEVLFN